jgi:hypothetical protein
MGFSAPAPRLTTPMVALAWSILHTSDDGEAADMLARMIIDAAEADPHATQGREQACD